MLDKTDTVEEEKKEDLGLSTALRRFLMAKVQCVPCLKKKIALLKEVVSLFGHDSHRCLTFKYSITCEISLPRIQYTVKAAVRQ